MDSSLINPRYNALAQNPGIKHIAHLPHWSISDANKRPIDMEALKTYLAFGGIIRGAQPDDPNATKTLDEVYRILPDAANFAYDLDAVRDKLIVIDIEPKATEETKRQLCTIPHLYAETSMSGKGIHLLVEAPEIINDPDVSMLSVVKSPDSTYEFLLCHWVTFTGNQLHLKQGRTPLEDVFNPLAKETAKKALERREATFDNLNDGDIPELAEILDATEGHVFQKTLDDFAGDASRLEFYQIGCISRWLDGWTQANNHEPFDDSERAHIMYRMAERDIPPRPKHNDTRCGLPYLLYTIRAFIQKTS